MQLFGLTIARTSRLQKELQPVWNNPRAWHSLIAEPFQGAWQRNITETVDSVLQYGPVFACQTLIASDVAKCWLLLVEKDANGIWSEVARASPFWPVLRKPNHFQTRIQFIESWVLSKLSWGNTYAIKARDARGVVVGLYILDPARTRPLVSDQGEVFYELRKDNLSRQQQDTVVVPAREIIHDRYNTFFHPLCGLSPLFAATLPASQGLKMQRQSAAFWQQGARPSGILTAPAQISQDVADRLKNDWETKFSGDNAGRVAVLGDGLTYEPMTMKSTDAQLVEQLGLSAKQIAAIYHVPGYKVGAEPPPAYNNIEALQQDYYGQCLQRYFEDIEACLDEGLGLDKVAGQTLGTMFDVDDLLRMDTKTQYEALEKAKNVLTLDERRRKVNAGPITGGDTVYLQQQDHSIEAIAARDSMLIEQAENPQPVIPALPANDEVEAAFAPQFLKALSEALDAA